MATQNGQSREPQGEERDLQNCIKDAPQCLCGARLNEPTDKFCCQCGMALIHMHERCIKCGFSAIPDGTPMNYCPLCANPWPRCP